MGRGDPDYAVGTGRGIGITRCPNMGSVELLRRHRTGRRRTINSERTMEAGERQWPGPGHAVGPRRFRHSL